MTRKTINMIANAIQATIIVGTAVSKAYKDHKELTPETIQARKLLRQAKKVKQAENKLRWANDNLGEMLDRHLEVPDVRLQNAEITDGIVDATYTAARRVHNRVNRMKLSTLYGEDYPSAKELPELRKVAPKLDRDSHAITYAEAQELDRQAEQCHHDKVSPEYESTEDILRRNSQAAHEPLKHWGYTDLDMSKVGMSIE